MKIGKVQKIRCTQVTKHVCEHLDEKMNSPLCRQIKKHLQGCPDCTAYLDGLKKTIDLYRANADLRIPQSAHKKLFAALKLEP